MLIFFHFCSGRENRSHFFGFPERSGSKLPFRIPETQFFSLSGLNYTDQRSINGVTKHDGRTLQKQKLRSSSLTFKKLQRNRAVASEDFSAKREKYQHHHHHCKLDFLFCTLPKGRWMLKMIPKENTIHQVAQRNAALWGLTR